MCGRASRAEAKAAADFLLFFAQGSNISAAPTVAGSDKAMRPLARRVRFCLVAAFAALSSLQGAVLAQDMVTIPTGTTKAVMKYNVCRMVKNTTGSSILVPLGSSGEWTGGSSFNQHAPNFNGINVTLCKPEGGDDASFCDPISDGSYAEACGGSTTPVIIKQSSFLPVTLADVAAWKAAVAWARNNPGAPVSARPAHILPACYKDSSMNEVSPSVATVGYIPAGSDFCILTSYHQAGHVEHGSGGRDDTQAKFYRHWRIWRSS